jgi:Ca2+-binding RTX toxin-like protein
VSNLVDGRRGPDRILGSDGEEIALGGGGNDVLIGYGGRDLLNGGGGADTIRSRDGLRDQISCGRGDGRREKAIRDRWDTKITIVVGGAWEQTEPISC